MQAIGSLMNLGMNAILISFSSTAVAVFGVYFKLQEFRTSAGHRTQQRDGCPSRHIITEEDRKKGPPFKNRKAKVILMRYVSWS